MLLPIPCLVRSVAQSLRRTDTRKIQLSSISTTAKGTKFESECIATLQRQHAGEMQLYRKGGAGDKGVDFLGWWDTDAPGSDEERQQLRIRIIGQCKAYSKQIGPAHVREFIAVVLKAQSMGQQPVLGILCAQNGFSQGAYSAMQASGCAMGLYKPIHKPMKISTGVSDQQGLIYNNVAKASYF